MRYSMRRACHMFGRNFALYLVIWGGMTHKYFFSILLQKVMQLRPLRSLKRYYYEYRKCHCIRVEKKHHTFTNFPIADRLKIVMSVKFTLTHILTHIFLINVMIPL